MDRYINVPLSEEAQTEARFLMLAANNLLKPSDGKPVTVPTQDMVLGSYYLTIVKNDEKGKFTFELPKYTVKDHGKTFTYEIYEVNKGQDGMTYDESVYTFTVKITDNKKGKLQLEKTLTLGDKVVDVATFTNYFLGMAVAMLINKRGIRCKKLLWLSCFKKALTPI